MVPSAGQGACQAFEDAYVLAHWLQASPDPVEAFANFRRIRIPRVHGVQRLSLANMNFRHQQDTNALKEAIAAGKASVKGTIDWVWGYEPTKQWDKVSVVPAIYADAQDFETAESSR